MIQRIQTIFLLLACSSFFSLLKFPFATCSNSISPLFEDQLFNIYDNSLLLGQSMIGGALSIVAVFLFRNRLIQKRFVLLAMIVSVILGCGAFYLMMSTNSVSTSELEISNEIGLYMPFVCLLMLILSYIFINKDEKIVRSSNRLR